MTQKAPTQRQLDQKIKVADDKITKYKGYIANLQKEKRQLQAQKRTLAEAAAKKTTAKKPAAKKTTAVAKKAATTKATAATKAKTTAKKKVTTTKKTIQQAEPSLLEGLLEGVKQAGIDPQDLLDSLLGKK